MISIGGTFLCFWSFSKGSNSENNRTVGFLGVENKQRP